MIATMSDNTPPQALRLFNYTSESITSTADDIIARLRAAADKVVAEVAVENATFDNSVRPILHMQNEVYPEAYSLRFFDGVHPDAAIREASAKAGGRLDDLDLELAMREDMFERVNAVYQSRESAGLDLESLHTLDKVYKEYTDAGLLLPAGPSRDHFKDVQLELNRICTEANSNLNGEAGGIFFTPEELAGVPEDAVNTAELEKGTGENEGKVKVGFKRDVSGPLMAYASRAETRRDYYIANQNKLNKNTPLFQKIILLRDEAARLLGYKDHASLKISANMAKTPENVNGFQSDIESRAKGSVKGDIAQLLQHKKTDFEARSLAFDGELYAWDVDYYERIQKEKDYSVDAQAIAEYFALWPTVNDMFGIFSQLFGLRFEQLDEAARAKLSPTGNSSDVAWHEDVCIYIVHDQDASFMGYLYLDMHPRDNKFSGGATAGIGPGSLDNSDGCRRFPYAALICNFTKPTKEKPSLLKHSEAVILFHELGHAIHSLVAKTKYAYNHGTAVARDFCEAPSQMLEYWCWLPNVLKSLSSHWHTGQPIPDDLVDKLVKTKNVNKSIDLGRLLLVGTYDMSIHGPESAEALKAIDFVSLWNQRRADISGIKGPESAGYGQHWGQGFNSIHHYIAGYDAGYYGYLYSEVFSADMYYTAFKADPLNSEQGRRYRRAVLEKGGSLPEMELLKDFLGREPNSDAFFEELGL